VGEYCIKKALAALDEEDYDRVLAKLAAGKWDALQKETNLFARRKKVQDYLLQKGYEPALINEAVKRIESDNPSE
jgi:regulatory protein